MMRERYFLLFCPSWPGEFIAAANGKDELLAFSLTGSSIQKVSLSDCSVKPITPWDRTRYDLGEAWPTFLLDGQHFLYTGVRSNKQHDVYLGSLGGEPGKLLMHNAADASYAAGKLFFERDGYLYAQPFDAAKFRFTGEPIAVLNRQLAFLGVEGVANYTVVANVLAYHDNVEPPVQLTWLDYSGNRLDDMIEPGVWAAFRIAPDGKRLLATKGDPLNHTGDLWLVDVARKSASKLTKESPSGGVTAVWSPDGNQIAVGAAIGAPRPVLFLQAPDGTRKRLPVPDPKNVYYPMDWSPDGRALLYQEGDSSSDKNGLGVYPLTSSAKPYRLFANDKANFDDARFSPDGHWISYNSDTSGRMEVYVSPFGRAGTPVQISTQGGTSPRWMPDGKHLLYVAADNHLVIVPLELGTTASAANARSLFQLPATTVDNPPEFEIAPDGKRLLVAAPVGQTSAPITVVVNWLAELKKVPTANMADRF